MDVDNRLGFSISAVKDEDKIMAYLRLLDGPNGMDAKTVKALQSAVGENIHEGMYKKLLFKPSLKQSGYGTSIPGSDVKIINFFRTKY